MAFRAGLHYVVLFVHSQNNDSYQNIGIRALKT